MSTATRAAHKSGAKSAKRAVTRPSRRPVLLWSVLILAFVAILTSMVIVSRQSPSAAANNDSPGVGHPAPAFSLTNTDGRTVSLAGYRGRTVVLYFNEGVGCDVCFYQTAEFEKHAADLTKAGVTILPIVMNPANQVRPELTRFGLHTPYLIDGTGSVSKAYGVLGKGMHADMPGHGFVLVDKNGVERWYGEYPSMYLSTADLLKQVTSHLPS
ncbi:MAG TPA: peroxiredoxin family protein [Pseudonocardiaceae bacterium]